jgi:hypothetical protein
MAKVNNNIFIRGLSGKLGDQFIVKTDKGGRTIVSAKPIFNDAREFSPAQLAQQQAFREAAAYAKEKKGEEIYITKANGGAKSPYNIAVADWFNRPEILEVDMSGWTNGSGGVIRVRAQDDVRVEEVKVTIADENGTLLEEGQAQDVGALWWEYNTAQAFAMNLFVTVAAKDLPGHVTERGEVVGHPRMP